MELPIEKREDVIQQLERLNYSAQWGIFSEYRSGASNAIVEITELLCNLFGSEEAKKLLVEAGVNHAD